MKFAPHEEIRLGERTVAQWITAVHNAPAAPEVLKLCVEFLATWDAGLREKLPKSCQPPLAMNSAANVSSYAFHLVQERLRQPRPNAELDAMATFFAAATTRLAQLLAAPRYGFPVPFFNARPLDVEREESDE
ncbi:MAG TPA: hypothetical protein VHP55_05465 [Usitatibacter sp.]|nr:hypothetical protein [Usitatibacter sp.]